MSLSRILKAPVAEQEAGVFRFRPLGLVAGADGFAHPGNGSGVQANVFNADSLAKAYEEGYQAGREVGQRLGREEIQPTIAALNAFLTELDGLRTRLFRRAETQAAELALRVAEVVLRREVSAKPETVLEMVRHALDLLNASEGIELHLHPKIFQIVERARMAGDKSAGGFENIRIQPDSSLAEDGFRIDTPIGEVATDLTAQVDEIARRLEIPRSARENGKG